MKKSIKTLIMAAAMLALRDQVNAALEAARAEKKIGKSLEAALNLDLPAPEKLAGLDLSELFIVSMTHVEQGETRISVRPAPGEKCPRCWRITPTPSADGLCPRCAKVVSFLN